MGVHIILIPALVFVIGERTWLSIYARNESSALYLIDCLVL